MSFCELTGHPWCRQGCMAFRRLHRPPHAQLPCACTCCAIHCGIIGTLKMALLDASACFVWCAGRQHAVTKQLPAPLAPLKRLQASGESPLTPESRNWLDNSRAGLLPICRATAHMHAFARSLPRSCARSTGVVVCANGVRQMPPTIALLHGRAQKAAQEAAKGCHRTPSCCTRGSDAPTTSQTLIRSQSDTQTWVQAGKSLTACWDAPDAAAGSQCYPSGAQQDPCLQPHAEDVEPPPCMSCPPFIMWMCLQGKKWMLAGRASMSSPGKPAASQQPRRYQDIKSSRSSRKNCLTRPQVGPSHTCPPQHGTCRFA